MAESLPSEAELRRASGLVAHVYSTPLGEVMALSLRDLSLWAGDAAELLRRQRER